MFEALIGDHSSLPRVFGLDDYRRLNPHVNITGIVWYEFLSTDPEREAQWAQRLADSSDVPMAIVGLVDFLAPDLERRLDTYEGVPNVRDCQITRVISTSSFARYTQSETARGRHSDFSFM
jgi:predicted TIM-barrel fold metal-dependent hydrolase